MGQPTTWWEGLYASSDVETLPWFTPELDRDFETAFATQQLKASRVLDLGTGPATQAINLARRGFKVIGTDISPSAIRKAKAAAKAANLKIEFRVDNILRSRLPAAFVEVIVDRGVFHVLPPEDRPTYVETVHRVLRPSGWLFLKCFSHKERGSWGPYRIAPDELRSYFRNFFEVRSVVETVFDGTLAPAPRALFAKFERK
jgi:cyclopropane fatty-acyl-phospholipid synthase-like methyltransferase